MKRLRGSKPVLAAREDAYVRGLSENGDHVCVPWIGIDMEGRYVCPGFEYKPNRGLVAYIVPLVLQREVGLLPGFMGTPVLTLPPRPQRDPNTLGGAIARIGQQKPTQLSQDALSSEYFRLLKRYLRMVKISGLETENKFIPFPDDYYVVVHGPYERSLIGHLVARPDGTGARFFVPDGQRPGAQQKILEASRITNSSPPSADTGVPPPPEPITGVGDSIPAPSPGGAAVRMAAETLSGSNDVYGVEGVPKPGKKYSKEVECET